MTGGPFRYDAYFDPFQVNPDFIELGHLTCLPDAEAIVTCCRMSKAGRVAEIGSFVGASATLIVYEGDVGRLWCIDTWNSSPTDAKLYEGLAKDEVYLTFMRNMRRMIESGDVIPIRTDSVSAATLFDDGFFDMVYIDGDHTYESVWQDIEAWAPKVRAGGILCGHDFMTFGGVMRAVLEFGHSGRRENVWWRIME